MNNNRFAFTLVECIVVLAILATLIVMLWPSISGIRGVARRSDGGESESEPQLPQSVFLSTVQHDGHWFVLSSAAYTAPAFFQHHPDCPCRTRTAEEEQ